MQKQRLVRPRLSLPPQIQNEVSGGRGGGGGGGLDFPRAEKPLKEKQEGVEREVLSEQRRMERGKDLYSELQKQERHKKYLPFIDCDSKIL